MSKKNKGLYITLVLLLLVGIGAAIFGFLLPYHAARSAMAQDGLVVMERQADGRQMLSWSASERADQYRVEILEPGAYQEEPALLYREFTDETSLLLPPLPQGMTLILRISSGIQFQSLAGEDIRYGEEALEMIACFDCPAISDMGCIVDGDTRTALLQVQSQPADTWQYQLLDSTGAVLQEDISDREKLKLTFGQDAIPLPEQGESYRLVLRARREQEGLLLIGKPEEPIEISWESLQYRTLDPVLTETAKNTVTITWQQTRGAGYEVQLLDETNNTWNTVASFSREDERSYTSPWLEPENSYCYRVVALDDLAPGEYLIVSGPLNYETRELTTYATVWPVIDLTAFRTAYLGEVVGTAFCGRAYCVLEESNGMFAVRIGDGIGYIDSNFCMINLPEYIGPLCSYDITNSYSSIYMIHGFGIPDVTGVITAGYEDIYQEDDTQLVPLLYPTAKKLINAAKAAREEGYRLKIYDSFRPYIATRQIFDLTSLIMDLPVPDTAYDGTPASEMELPEPGPGRTFLNYGWLMTGNMYGLNSFLAQVTSAHNLGIALDLTLEDLETGEEIAMQSAMHDLSHYSVVPENNEPADRLAYLMTKAGFGTLISEWWHFQDNASRSALGLRAVGYGVNAECWVKDDIGWKYRTEKGSFCKNETVTIAKIKYTFDENGYVIS